MQTSKTTQQSKSRLRTYHILALIGLFTLFNPTHVAAGPSATAITNQGLAIKAHQTINAVVNVGLLELLYIIGGICCTSQVQKIWQLFGIKKQKPYVTSSNNQDFYRKVLLFPSFFVGGFIGLYLLGRLLYWPFSFLGNRSIIDLLVEYLILPAPMFELLTYLNQKISLMFLLHCCLFPLWTTSLNHFTGVKIPGFNALLKSISDNHDLAITQEEKKKMPVTATVLSCCLPIFWPNIIQTAKLSFTQNSHLGEIGRRLHKAKQQFHSAKPIRSDIVQMAEVSKALHYSLGTSLILCTSHGMQCYVAQKIKLQSPKQSLQLYACNIVLSWAVVTFLLHKSTKALDNLLQRYCPAQVDEISPQYLQGVLALLVCYFTIIGIQSSLPAGTVRNIIDSSNLGSVVVDYPRLIVAMLWSMIWYFLAPAPAQVFFLH
ncbi:MAG: hypothetical protein AAF380_03080 [Bacteroidota bacterium]